MSTNINTKSEIDKKKLDEQIQELQKIIDYEIKEYPVEVIVNKYLDGFENGTSELFVPFYQREFVWSETQQSRFIESLLLNLPIPYIFVADLSSDESDINNNEGRLEIVDGSQRIRTLVSFFENKLVLKGLSKLTEANGFKYCDLSIPRQKRFNRKTVRMIELTESTDDEARREIFDRLNSGGTEIKPMEQRRGVSEGEFLQLIEKCSKNELFVRICPISEVRKKLQEASELVLRYFAYCDQYLSFKKRVDEFLNQYLEEQNKKCTTESLQDYEDKFFNMLKFVEKYFTYGFKKDANNQSVPRIRFECIAVGVTLALEKKPDLIPKNIDVWINSDEFKIHTRSDASNSKPKVKARIEYVRDNLLGNKK